MGHTFASKKVAILHGPYDWEVNFTKGVREAAEAGGWNVVLNEEVQYNMTQWSSVFLKLRSAKPDLIVVETLDPTSVITFLEQFKRTPIREAVVYSGYALSTTALTDIVKQGGLDGVLGMTLSAQRPDAQGKEFEKVWEAEYKETPPMSIAAQVYDEVMLWADAVARAKDATAYDKVNKELEGITYKGLTGTIRFNPERYVPAGNDTQPSHLLQAQGGKIHAIMIGSEKVSDFATPSWAK